jgi:membrane fusion protein, heavy metal efflux system
MTHVRTIILLSLTLVACKPFEHGHAHDGEGDHGHREHAPTAAEPERPTYAVTKYQSGIELFMEYEAFAVGAESPLIAHFTDARNPDGFKAVTQGSVTAVLRYEDGTEQKFVAEKPLRDGIFKPVVKPSKAGKGTLALTLSGPQLADTVAAGEVLVHPSMKAALAAEQEPEGAEKAFPFLKEQQWKTVYATAAAEPRVLQGGVRANGELKAVAGQAAELSAPVAGRVPVGEAVPFLGQTVKKGQLLVRILPTAGASASDFATLELEASRARAELGLAERALQRAEEMLAQKAIPERQLDEARVAKEVAAARVAAAARQQSLLRSTRIGGGAVAGASYELRSPLDGVISFADVTPGAVVDVGARLASVVNTDKLWLEAKVYEPEAPLVERATGASFTVAGFDEEFTIDEQTGRLVAVGAVVDRITRTVPIVFELDNREAGLKPGMFAKVRIFTGRTIRAVAIPDSAVVDENGKPTVFVMAGGESFFKRQVRLGIRSNGFAEVLEGLAEGDRVVSRGAYEVKLATASGAIPDHGHQH